MANPVAAMVLQKPSAMVLCPWPWTESGELESWAIIRRRRRCSSLVTTDKTAQQRLSCMSGYRGAHHEESAAHLVSVHGGAKGILERL